MRTPPKTKRLRRLSDKIPAKPTGNLGEPIDKKLKKQETRSQSVASTKMAQVPKKLAAVAHKNVKSSK